MKEKNQEEIDDLGKEINKLSEQLTQAQYGEASVDEEGVSFTGEEREIDRIETQSLPQLRSLLEDLQHQLE